MKVSFEYTMEDYLSFQGNFLAYSKGHKQQKKISLIALPTLIFISCTFKFFNDKLTL